MIRTLSLALLLAAIVPAAQAAERGTFHISPRLGRGELRIGDSFTIAHENIDKDTVNVGCVLGYSTPFGLLLEVGAENQGNLNWWNAADEFELSQEYVAVGFELPFAEGWTFTPKGGRARWKLHSKEGQLFHPGPEAEKDIRGYQYFWEAQVTRQITPKIALGGAYQEAEFDFGRARSLSFVARFAF